MTNERASTAPRSGGTFRTFLAIWLTQSFSIVGSFVTYFAIVLWLSAHRYAEPDQTGELGFALAALTIALALPALLGTPFIGVWVDRADRRRLMITANLANAAVGAILGGVMLSGVLDPLGIWPLLLLMGANSFLGQLHAAALDASFVLIVPDRKLARANGMMQTTWSVADVLAPTIVVGFVALPGLADDLDLLGPLSATVARVEHGAALAVLFDAATFLVSAIVLSLLRIPVPSRAAPAHGRGLGRLVRDARAGVSFLRRRRSLLALLSIFTVANLASGPLFLLLPLLVREQLAADFAGKDLSFEQALALLTTIASAGGVAGGVAMTLWGGFRARRFLGVLLPVLAIGLLQIVVGLSHTLYLTAALLLGITLGEPLVRAHAQAIWQSQTPPELQGRVFAVRTLVAGALIPAGSAVAGWAGGVFGPGGVIAVLGAILALFALAQLCNTWLWRLDDPAAQAAPLPAGD